MNAEAADIVVVGLGPAGSRAAAIAAKAGYRVVAVDRRLEAGRPVQCAEFVPAMIERDIPNITAVAEQKITRMLTFTEATDCEETPDFRGWMIDRAAFDRMLADEAANAGTACRYGTSVVAIDIDGTVHTSDGLALKPRVLIGCDGPRSRVGAAIGQTNRALVDTRQLTAPLIVPHDATDIFLSADYRGGYGWLFPKGAVANIGVGIMIEDRRRLKPMLAALFASLSASRRIGTRPFALTGGAIPVGGRVGSTGRLGATQVLLAGDAAGLTNPVTGAGIASAVQSGALAGHAAADMLSGRSGALDDYDEELGDIFDAALSRALLRRRQVLAHYGDGRRPDATALAEGWIGSPNYWA
ncbi:geranylgeranyl reductase family protein [Bradyrhizobium sp. HKCCYLRH3059]|uniref:geranylgeranyl reductase family protein n=1 Tax=Bradyrhizobium sp. HKCCYLRH3059 TaxID=3420745 RepID=UPI003EBD9224